MKSFSDPRERALHRLGGNLYADHVHRFGNGKHCECEPKSPDDRDCDVGAALYRVQKREALKYDDGRNQP